MSRTCAKGKHEIAAGTARNQGLEFGRCGRCGRDLIRSRVQWRTVPGGFRVVWQRSAPGAGGFDTAQLQLDLSPVGRALALPGRPRERNPIMVALELAMLGARALGGAIAARLGLWAGAMAAPRRRAAPLLRLRAG